MIQPDRDYDDLCNVKSLNFTHRAAHGSGEDKDGKHGQYAELASSELARLQ